MAPRLLLDTHVVIRFLADPKKLSRDQSRTLDSAVQRNEAVALSAISLLEMAVLFGSGKHRIKENPDKLFDDLQASPFFRILPFTFEVASEVASVGDALRDPADRAIVATARIHHLRLVTSDARIIESNLVPVLE